MYKILCDDSKNKNTHRSFFFRLFYDKMTEGSISSNLKLKC